ncbi:hypothetical protein M0813_07632 [Anaeramoeba flamelloides]|uniref:B box-type domain-containing protein n=1 Tax=Anaeramoeba flamelloides TaxID=1746091 RepID=A0ABQ8XAP9_9EUKA|nr:hypothetical protein M0813_07632 [Anaeramoeba flamelloides]
MSSLNNCADCGSTFCVVFCNTCSSFYCQACDQENHPTKKLLEKHDREHLKKKQFKHNLMCDVHEKKLEYYCSEDNKLQCCDCIFSNCKDHLEHVVSINDYELMNKNFEILKQTKLVEFLNNQYQILNTLKWKKEDNHKTTKEVTEDLLDLRKKLFDQTSNILDKNKKLIKVQEQDKDKDKDKDKKVKNQFLLLKTKLSQARKEKDYVQIIQLSQQLDALSRKLEKKETIQEHQKNRNESHSLINQLASVEKIENFFNNYDLKKESKYGVDFFYSIKPSPSYFSENINFNFVVNFEKEPNLPLPPHPRISKCWLSQINLKKYKSKRRKQVRENYRKFKLNKKNPKQINTTPVPPKPYLFIIDPQGNSIIFSRFKKKYQFKNFYVFSGTYKPKYEGKYQIHLITFADKYFTYPKGIPFEILPLKEKKLNNSGKKNKKTKRDRNIINNSLDYFEEKIKILMKNTSKNREEIITQLNKFNGDIIDTLNSLI